MKQYVLPKKLFKDKKTISLKNLKKKQPLQIGLTEPNVTCFSKGEHIILDFGAEICGGIRILTHAADNVPVRIRFGESITECCAELGGETNATNDHSLRDFTVRLQNYSDMTFGQTGFRFVRLDFDGEVRIKSVVAESHCFRKKAHYEYNGNDERIRQIYKAAKRTVDLCVSSGYVWDGVKRDRLVWIGDIHPEMLALTTLYGQMKELEISLDFVRDQTPLPAWMNWYPTYSMWWIIIVAEYYERTGARAFTERQLPYLKGLIDQMNSCVYENGDLDLPHYFVDWPTSGQPDEIIGSRAINVMAVKRAIYLLNEFGESTSQAEGLLAKLMKQPIVPVKSKQVTALKYFATGELTDEEKERLVAGGAQGMSTFMSYYVLKAVASFDKAKAVEMMKDYYGAMLDKGATTFWEDFDMAWVENSGRIDAFPKKGQKDIHGDYGAYCYKGFRHSLCHGWSAGIIAFMKEEL